MLRDLELDCDPAALVLSPPDRSELKEIFRRFEFRGLLSRLDTLDEALPAAAPRAAVIGEKLAWVEGEVPKLTGRIGVAVREDRMAVAREGGPVVVAPVQLERIREAEVVAHDCTALPR